VPGSNQHLALFGRHLVVHARTPRGHDFGSRAFPLVVADALLDPSGVVGIGQRRRDRRGEAKTHDNPRLYKKNDSFLPQLEHACTSLVSRPLALRETSGQIPPGAAVFAFRSPCLRSNEPACRRNLTIEHSVNYVPSLFHVWGETMVRAVAEEALALASVALFLAMVAVWVQVLVVI
jgi:hypothetical protein